MELTERELRLIFKGLLAIDPGVGRDKEFTALLKRVGDEIMARESAREVRESLRRRGYGPLPPGTADRMAADHS